ncbi:hypothetical protein MKW94_005042 [Papaver nudicaule]|uniref:Uncharacterized protein n=1 Tax=Papaver nudicaule TaxID=74823 RepID=A0AA41S6V1_PAPNU|nr:hypothetical protein [Papaver nudicaule]
MAPPPPVASNQALPNNSIVVISPQYCTPYQVDLYTANRDTGVTEGRHFAVFDINGNSVFKVTPASPTSSHLLLVDAAGPLLYLKPMFFSLHDRWKVYRGHNADPKNLLFSTRLDVFLASNTDAYACDFKIKQNLGETSCVINRGNSDSIIAEMHRNKNVQDKVGGMKQFSVTVYPNVDYIFVIALSVVLNEINVGGGGSSGGDGGAVGGGGGGGCGGGG